MKTGTIPDRPNVWDEVTEKYNKANDLYTKESRLLERVVVGSFACLGAAALVARGFMIAFMWRFHDCGF